MPEGHTIHRLAQDLNKAFEGHEVQASSPQGRFDEGSALIDRQRCTGFEAFGKHLVGTFEAADVLHVHLGLIGKFRKESGDPVGEVRLRLSHDDVHWDLRGPMVCRVGTPDLIEEVAASVGPDPLREPKAGDRFAESLTRRRIPIGAALLDQKLIAGIGNVYRAELLFLLGIDPQTPANLIDEQSALALWDLTVAQLRRGKKLNRIVTVDPKEAGFRSAAAVPNSERLFVYKREDEPCRRCGTLVTAIEVGGRTTWRCEQCQS